MTVHIEKKNTFTTDIIGKFHLHISKTMLKFTQKRYDSTTYTVILAFQNYNPIHNKQNLINT